MCCNHITLALYCLSIVNSNLYIDIESWLEALGYDMDVLAPNMTFEGRLSHDSPLLPSEKALLPLISAFQCAYQQEMNNFLQLSLVPRSKLVSSIHKDTFGR